jgi:hypothetical protein
MKKQTRLKVPAFASEAEEAPWWYKNRNVHGKELLAAVRAGEAKILTKGALRRRVEASKETPALGTDSRDKKLLRVPDWLV